MEILEGEQNCGARCKTPKDSIKKFRKKGDKMVKYSFVFIGAIFQISIKPA